MKEVDKEGFPRLEFRVDPGHCVETLARREYLKLTRAYLRGEGDEGELGGKIDLLWEFLECADFRALRRVCEERLREGKDVSFVLYREGGSLRYGFADEENRDG